MGIAALTATGLHTVEIDETTIALPALVDHRDDLVKTRTQTLNRLHGLLTQLIPAGAPTHLSADTLLLSASFSPDGQRIVYAQSGFTGQPDIFTVAVDGTDRSQVTRNPKWDSAPDWGPESDH